MLLDWRILNFLLGLLPAPLLLVLLPLQLLVSLVLWLHLRVFH